MKYYSLTINNHINMIATSVYIGCFRVIYALLITFQSVTQDSSYSGLRSSATSHMIMQAIGSIWAQYWAWTSPRTSIHSSGPLLKNLYVYSTVSEHLTCSLMNFFCWEVTCCSSLAISPLCQWWCAWLAITGFCHATCAKFGVCRYLILKTTAIMSLWTVPFTPPWQSLTLQFPFTTQQCYHCAQRWRCCTRLRKYGVRWTRPRRTAYWKPMASNGYPSCQISSPFFFHYHFHMTLCTWFGRMLSWMLFHSGLASLKVLMKATRNQFMPKVWEAIGAATADAGSRIPSVFGIWHIAKHKSSYSVEAWSFWTLYLGPMLLHWCFCNQHYYKHFMELVKLLQICLEFEITTDEVQTVCDGFINWVEDYKKWV